MNKVLVVIVSYNSMQWIDRCYSSLQQSKEPCDIITIDNGSTDGTIEFIRSHYPEVDLRIMQKNLGFGKANNIGLQKALDCKYQYVYLLNQDAWIMPDTISTLISVSQSHPDYGILSPMQLSANMQNFDRNFVSNVIGNHQKQKPLLVEDLFFGREKSIYDVTFVMAAHWFITRECLSMVGGFSPTFFHYGEDDNYLNRARFWKFKIGIVPKAKAVHDRADLQWSKEKELYISAYTMILNAVSNPLDKHKLLPFIKSHLKKAIRYRNRLLWNYALKLWKERASIEKNYQISLKPLAFLIHEKIM